MLVLMTLVLGSGRFSGGRWIFGYFFENAGGGIFFGGVDGHVSGFLYVYEIGLRWRI